jgi:putative membrane protein
MKRTPTLKMLPVALLSLGFAAGALAQTASPNPAPSSSTNAAQTARDIPAASGRAKDAGKSSLSHGERKFIEEAAKGGMAEVELGQFAQEHASNPQVKQFAQKMVQDHSKANEELRSLAQAKGVTVPSGPKHAENHEMSKLAKLQGDAFDREYMDHMVKDHQKDVKEFQKQADRAKDEDVRKFAANTVPTLQEHLNLAQQADAAVGGKQASKQSNKQSKKTAMR